MIDPRADFTPVGMFYVAGEQQPLRGLTFTVRTRGAGGAIAGVGVAVGLTGAFFVGQVMKSQLVNVAPTNPVVLALVTVGLAAVAILASGIPALRASRINPIVVLSK